MVTPTSSPRFSKGKMYLMRGSLERIRCLCWKVVVVFEDIVGAWDVARSRAEGTAVGAQVGPCLPVACNHRPCAQKWVPSQFRHRGPPVSQQCRSTGFSSCIIA